MFKPLLGQEKLYLLEGSINDSESMEVAPFCHVSICGTTYGTVADRNGEFLLHIKQQNLYDTLCISSVGYKLAKFPINGLKDGFFFKLEIEPETNMLTEIIISDKRITPQTILRKAGQKINKNYDKSPFTLQGYYRDYLKSGDEIVSFLDGEATYIDKGIMRGIENADIYMHKMRFSEDYGYYYEKFVNPDPFDSTRILVYGVSSEYKPNEFSNMMVHDPIRNHTIAVPFIGVFDEMYLKNYSFHLLGMTYYKGHKVYVIDLKPKIGYYHVNVEGRIYIRVDDYAVLKMDYAYFVNKWGKEQKWYEINLEYREVGDFFYLDYLAYVNFFKIHSIEGLFEFQQYREFFVNEISKGSFIPSGSQNKVDRTRPLYQQEFADRTSIKYSAEQLFSKIPPKE